MAALLSAACATTAGSSGDGIDAIAATTTKLPPHEPRYERDRPVVAVIAHHRGAEITQK